jgi:site-specific recombinase XerD
MPETKTISPLKKYIRDFLEYCEIEKNQSPKTIENYNHYLHRFADFAQERGLSRPEQISLEDVRGYRLYLNRLRDETGKPLKLITQNYHTIAVRAFLKYLTKRDVKTLAPEKN